MYAFPPMVIFRMGLFTILPAVFFGQEVPAQRLPEPPAEAQRESEKMIREVFKEEYARKSAADQKGLARKLLQQGIETRDDPTARYVLFGESREIAEKVGDLETAMAAIAEAARVYEIDGTALKAKTLIEMAAGTKSPEAASALTDVCLEVIDEAVREEKFDVARSLVPKAESAAKAAKDLKKVVQVQKKGKEIEELSKESQKAKEAAKKLESNPEDQEASLALGRYLLVKGDVEKALGLLAKGSDALLRAAAEKDLAGSADARRAVEAGDAWWDLAEQEKVEIRQVALMMRAKKNYEKGRAGSSGLTKAKVEKRLAEIEKKMAGAGASPGPTGGSQDFLTLDLGGGVKMDFVYIKAGTFTMGGTDAPHRVEITKGYWMGKYEVTQGQWEAVMGSNPSKGGPDMPVGSVSWDDCQIFMKRLNEKARSQLRERVAALPTEAQWEYACGAGTTTRWFFGDDETKLSDYGWFNGNSGLKTHPVGKKKPNPWGLYDMYGNSWEWCQDWGGAYGGDEKDPQGPSSGVERIIRGACVRYGPLQCSTWYREDCPPSGRAADLGFRACLR